MDLTDPDVRLLTTPRISNYAAGNRETGGLTVSHFLKTHHLQAAINANFFDPEDYYLPAGTPMDVYGLAVSEGVVAYLRKPITVRALQEVLDELEAQSGRFRRVG